MKDDGILPGDLVVVRKQETARNGQTVVALVNHDATIKTYFKKGSHIELHPANATMQPIIVRPSDAFHIEGILIGVIRHCTGWGKTFVIGDSGVLSCWSNQNTQLSILLKKGGYDAYNRKDPLGQTGSLTWNERWIP